MVRRTCVAVAATAALAASCVSISTIAVARGGGTGTAAVAHPIRPPTVIPPTPPPASFNSPGSQAAPLRSGNPANQGTPMSLIAPQGFAPSSGGRPRVTNKGKESDVWTIDRNVDKRLDICRGC
jgi:hypothetical protein